LKRERVKQQLNESSKECSYHWELWLTPIIPATQEAGIRRISVPNQSRQTVHETVPQTYPTQKGLAQWLKQ
jgi:hypothetical protein